MMKSKLKKLEGPKLIRLNQFKDVRGGLARVFCMNAFLSKKIEFNVKQVNHVCVIKKGTIKGMHFQIKPYAEIKSINLIKGKIIDVIIDIRKNSKNFLKTKTFILDSKENKTLVIPKGLAHGFQTLTDNCEIIYCHSEDYNNEKERSINPFDSKINIKWPIKISNISSKDKETNFISNDFKGYII